MSALPNLPSRSWIRACQSCLVVAALSSAWGAGMASAETLVRPFAISGAANFNTAMDPGQTWGDSDGEQTSIPAFDPSLGPLTGWRITLDGSWSIQLGGEAYATSPTNAVSADLSGGAAFRLTVPLNGSGFLDLAILGPFSTPIETCSGIGSCVVSIPNAAAGDFSIDSGVLDPSEIPPAGLDPLSLLWDLSVATSVTTTAHGGTGWSAIYASNLSQLDASGAITFYYAPEPGAGLMIGAGLGALVGARRRSA